VILRMFVFRLYGSMAAGCMRVTINATIAQPGKRQITLTNEKESREGSTSGTFPDLHAAI
jgi:hypothetical protein